jgi:glycerol-3-phosphate acyltransferase PlsY
MSTTILISAIIGYFLGSIPFGLILTKMSGAGDIRKIGSGNIGATNVLRTGKKGIAALTVLLDFAKSAGAYLLAFTVFDSETTGVIAGLAAVLGHNFPVWLNFRGGKGVASTIGFFCAADWQLCLICCGIWLISAIITKYSSLSALIMLFCAPFVAYFLQLDGDIVVACSFLMMLGFIRHHANISRLAAGTEGKIKFKKKN